MKKLINLNVIEAKNVICVWREDCDEHRDYSAQLQKSVDGLTHHPTQIIPPNDTCLL